MAFCARRSKLSTEDRRSNVRRYVTYWVISVYLLLASVVVLWLMWAGRHDLAIGVLSGVAGIAGSITGFWFGARKPEPPKGDKSSGDEDSQTSGK